MKTKLELVKQWRKAFSLPCSDTPKILSQDQLDLHAKLIGDESLECMDATSVVKIRDFIADMQYYILCLAAEAGISEEQMEKDFAEVHRSNMTKMWTSVEVRRESPPCWNSIGWTSKKVNDTERCYIVRDSYGKIVKSPSYEKAKLV
jgi:phosphoribosyl-ATP pyrophosphohydrolase